VEGFAIALNGGTFGLGLVLSATDLASPRLRALESNLTRLAGTTDGVAVRVGRSFATIGARVAGMVAGAATVARGCLDP